MGTKTTCALYTLDLRGGSGSGSGSGRRMLVRSRTPNGDPTTTSGQCFMGGALLPSEGCKGTAPLGLGPLIPCNCKG